MTCPDCGLADPETGQPACLCHEEPARAITLGPWPEWATDAPWWLGEDA